MKKIYAVLILAGLLNDTLPVYSQNYPTNNIKSYDAKSAVVEINGLYDRLLKGEDISALATKYTQDPGSFEKNGILRKFKLNLLEETFAANIKKLKPGEISKPFETSFGWHIAKLLDISIDNEYLIQHILIRYE